MALKDLWGRIAGKKQEAAAAAEAAAEARPQEQAAAPPDAAAAPAPADEAPKPAGFFGRLRAGLARSAAKLTENLGALFTKRKLDDAALEELEETLIAADLGLAASRRIVERFRRTRFGRDVTETEIREALAEEIAAILAPVAKPLLPDVSRAPFTLLMVGVNGTGKTTTIGKLGAQWTAEGHCVAFAAGDTFRAAAVEQLQLWGERTGCRVHAPEKQGADAAGLAFDALSRAKQDGTDILLIDTAGRLHNKTALMEELRKILRVLRRVDETAPHAVVLTLDATTGQNAIQQVKVFREMVEVSGLVVTKLDGSAKGGVVVALAEEFGLPVHAVGVGEKAEDLRPFDPREFARSLVGLDA
jgi:fused signal recognition particle receptor